LPCLAVLSGRFAVLVGIVMVAGRRQTEPRKASQSLALGQHIAGDPGLPRRQGVGQQVTLQLGNTRPVLQVKLLLRSSDLHVIRWQRRYGTFQIADRRKVLVQALLVFLWQPLAQEVGVLLHRIQNTALAVNPSLVASAEQTVEQVVRK